MLMRTNPFLGQTASFANRRRRRSRPRAAHRLPQEVGQDVPQAQRGREGEPEALLSRHHRIRSARANRRRDLRIYEHSGH